MDYFSFSYHNTICSEIRLENIQGTLELKFMSILPFQILLLVKKQNRLNNNLEKVLNLLKKENI